MSAKGSSLNSSFSADLHSPSTATTSLLSLDSLSTPLSLLKIQPQTNESILSTRHMYVCDLELAKMQLLAKELRHDWQDIAYEFPDLFSQHDIAMLKTTQSPPMGLLQMLRDNGVLLSKFVSILSQLHLITACEIIHDNNKMPSTTNIHQKHPKNSVNMPFDLMHSNLSGLLYNTNNSAENSLNFLSQEATAFFNICESILPMIEEKDLKFVAILNGGKFNQFACVKRKLVYLSRNFTTFEEIIKELKIMKYSHFNIYRPECILKLENQAYSLLYPSDNLHFTLSSCMEYQKPNILAKLSIARDIASAFIYLHSIFGKIPVYYNKLVRFDSVLIRFVDEFEVHAKLYDFSSAIFSNKEDKNLKNQDYHNYGLFILSVTQNVNVSLGDCMAMHQTEESYGHKDDKRLFRFNSFKSSTSCDDKNCSFYITSYLFVIAYAFTSPALNPEKRNLEKVGTRMDELYMLFKPRPESNSQTQDLL